MFEKIKKWYEQRLWTEAMVRKAAEKGVISQMQCEEILLADGSKHNENAIEEE